MLGCARSTTALFALTAACGSRSGLDPLQGGNAGTTGPVATLDGGNAATADANAGVDTGGPVVLDRCPSALQAGAPLPIVGNCSTRDGRARVAGPKSPHVTWIETLPPDPDPTSGYYIAGLAADASGAAYVVLGPNFGADVASLIRVDGATGSFDWTTPFTPSTQGNGLPLLPSTGPIEIVATGPKLQEPSIDRFAVATGALTTSSLVVGPNSADNAPAVGADGALYASYTANAGSVTARSVVSRLHADGTLDWTSVDLGTLGPPPDGDNDVFPSTVALGTGDLVIVATSVITQAFDGTVLIALDPTTGAARWASPLQGELLGGPAVAPDGSIVVLVAPPLPKLVVFEPSGSTRRTVSIGQGADVIFAIGLDGTVVVGADDTQGLDGLIAIDGSGHVAWTASITDVRSVTIDTGGTLLTSMSGGIEGIDLATGHVRWTVAAPHPTSCLASFTLTSAGGLVATQCDDTVFGVHD